MQTRFQFRHVNELTGLFVLAVLVLAAAGLLMAARSQQWFAARAEFMLQLPREGAYGLKPGNDVVLLGLPAGTVRDVFVEEDGGLRAGIAVRRDFARFVCADSAATIKKVFGVAGDSYVEISRGQGPPLEPGKGVIVCDSSEELPTVMDRLLNELRGEVLPLVRQASELLAEWRRLGTNLNGTQEDLREAVARFNRIAARLEDGQGAAGRLLTDAGIVDSGERTLARAEEALAELQVLIEQLQEGTAHLPAITGAVAAEARDLPGLVLQLHRSANELQRLTEAMQRHWLLRGYVEPRSTGGRIPPEQVAGGAP